MLIARSAPECHLYMDLHPCSCGAAVFEVRHTLRMSPSGDLVAVYTGICPRCGLPRLFEFTLAPETPPPPPAYGGTAPSQVICPGEFALVADRYARSASTQPADLTEGQRRRDRSSLAQAVAAMAEIVKFIPAGADAVPPEAFTSIDGRAVYAGEPGRFRRGRLEAVLGAYREILATYA